MSEDALTLPASSSTHTPSAQVTSRTLRLERVRALTMGVFESAPNIFILLIAVRWFKGTSLEKSLLAGSVHAGLLIAPLIIFAQRYLRVSAARGVSMLLLIAGCSMAIAGFVTERAHYTLFAALALLTHSACTPLVTSMFTANIPAPVRGKYFAQCSMIRMAASIVFAAGIGWVISGRIHLYTWLICGYAVMLFAAAWLAKRIPDEGRSLQPVAPIMACFVHLKRDRVLRETIIAWNLLGFGNLMMVPLRIEYLANARYGLDLSEVEVALLISTIPNVARLITTGIWGRLFDSMNFFTLRMVLNLSFAIGTLSFFATGSWLLLVVSAVILGSTTAGGEVAWNLGVTKFTSPEKVPDYMAVHTFFTGLRGVVAPAVGFLLLQYFSIESLSWVSATLMLLSVVVLARVKRA